MGPSAEADKRRLVAPVVDRSAGQMLRPLDQPLSLAQNLHFCGDHEMIGVVPEAD